MNIFTLAGTFLLYAVAGSVLAQAPVSPPDDHPDRTEEVEPFHIIDNVYFVGRYVQGGIYLLTGSEGHMIFDTGYPEDVPVILENVKKLGFNPRDIKLILGTHAHADHVGGHSLMQEMTGGAQILSSEPDVEVVKTGGEADFRDGDWPPSEVDRVIKDGEVIRLGDIEVTAHLTPGHTKGCTTFTWDVEVDMQTYDVVLLCGVRMATRPLLGHPEYPEMAADFASTFAKLKTLPVDIYLGGHGYWYGLRAKMERMDREGYRAFIDPEGYHKALDGWQQQFLDQLTKESRELAGKR